MASEYTQLGELLKGSPSRSAQTRGKTSLRPLSCNHIGPWIVHHASWDILDADTGSAALHRLQGAAQNASIVKLGVVCPRSVLGLRKVARHRRLRRRVSFNPAARITYAGIRCHWRNGDTCRQKQCLEFALGAITAPVNRRAQFSASQCA